MTSSPFESKKSLWYAQKTFVEQTESLESVQEATPFGVKRKNMFEVPPCQPWCVSTVWISA